MKMGFNLKRGCDGRILRRAATPLGFEHCGQHSQGRRGAPTLGFAPKSLWDLRIADLDWWVMTSLTGRLPSFTGAYDSVQGFRAPPGAPDGAACFPLGQDALVGVG